MNCYISTYSQAKQPYYQHESNPTNEEIRNYLQLTSNKYSCSKLKRIIELLYQRLVLKSAPIQFDLSEATKEVDIVQKDIIGDCIKRNNGGFFMKYNSKFNNSSNPQLIKKQDLKRQEMLMLEAEQNYKKMVDYQRASNLGEYRPLNPDATTQDLITSLQQSAERIEGYLLKRNHLVHHLQMSNQTPQFHNSAMKNKYYEKMVTAITFCDKGYGINNMRKALSQNKYDIDHKEQQRRYKTVASGVVMEGFRRLQKFLRGCGYHIKYLNSLQIKPIYTYLLNCREHMERQLSDTLIQFVRLHFNIRSIDVFEGVSLRLYHTILKHLIKRFYQKSSHEKTIEKRRIRRGQGSDVQKPRDMWTLTLETQLLDEFIKLKKLSKVRDAFRERHNLASELLTINNLKNRVNKILRKTIRRLQKFNGQPKNALPKLLFLSEDSISTILESTEGLQCRILLSEISKDPQKVNFKLLSEVIYKINQYVWDRTQMINSLPQHDPIFNY